MFLDISSIAFAIRSAAKSSHPIKLSQAQQCSAAALGYKSLAAFQASGAGKLEFGANTHIVLDIEALMERSGGLGLPHDEKTLTLLVRDALKQKLPSVSTHDSVSEFEEALRDIVDSYVLNHVETSGQMAMANSNGLSEVYLPFDVNWQELAVNDEGSIIIIDGNISMNLDLERPYLGHQIDVKVALGLVRPARNVYVSSVELQHALLDRGVGDEDDDGPELISLAEALAEHLGLSFDEAEPLVDAEVQSIEGHDDAIYGYIFNFTNTDATQSVLRKIKKRHGSLNVTVPLNFFDRIHGRDANPTRHYVHGDQTEESPDTYYCAHCDYFVDQEHFDAAHPGRAEDRYFSSLRSWHRRPARNKINVRRPNGAVNILAAASEAQKNAREAGRSNFHRWIATKTKRQDPLGDLARDVISDRTFPTSESSGAQIRDYLERCGAVEQAMQAFDRAWKTFSKSKVSQQR